MNARRYLLVTFLAWLLCAPLALACQVRLPEERPLQFDPDEYVFFGEILGGEDRTLQVKVVAAINPPSVQDQVVTVTIRSHPCFEITGDRGPEPRRIVGGAKVAVTARRATSQALALTTSPWDRSSIFMALPADTDLKAMRLVQADYEALNARGADKRMIAIELRKDLARLARSTTPEERGAILLRLSRERTFARRSPRMEDPFRLALERYGDGLADASRWLREREMFLAVRPPPPFGHAPMAEGTDAVRLNFGAGVSLRVPKMLAPASGKSPFKATFVYPGMRLIDYPGDPQGSFVRNVADIEGFGFRVEMHGLARVPESGAAPGPQALWEAERRGKATGYSFRRNAGSLRRAVFDDADTRAVKSKMHSLYQPIGGKAVTYLEPEGGAYLLYMKCGDGHVAEDTYCDATVFDKATRLQYQLRFLYYSTYAGTIIDGVQEALRQWAQAGGSTAARR